MIGRKHLSGSISKEKELREGKKRANPQMAIVTPLAIPHGQREKYIAPMDWINPSSWYSIIEFHIRHKASKRLSRSRSEGLPRCRYSFQECFNFLRTLKNLSFYIEVTRINRGGKTLATHDFPNCILSHAIPRATDLRTGEHILCNPLRYKRESICA